MTYTILHNPNCSTSRKGLALLQDKGIEHEVRKYMTEAGRLSVEELKDLTKQLGADSPRVFLRDRKKEVPETEPDDALYQRMANDPNFVQRPIGIFGGKAVLGRPFENLLDIL